MDVAFIVFQLYGIYNRVLIIISSDMAASMANAWKSS